MSNFISDQEAMREFADNLWRQDFQFRVQKMLNHALNGYRAEVVENPGGGKLTVRFPFEESTRTFKCSESMRDSVVGDQVLVECLGSLSNPFIRCYADFRDVAFESAEEAIKAGVRDAVEFGPFLIVNGEPSKVVGNGGYGLHPRTVIGQRKDGVVLFLDEVQENKQGTNKM